MQANFIQIILKKYFSLISLVIVVTGLLLLSYKSNAQDEFMVYGVIKIQGGTTDSATIIVESEKVQYGRTITLDPNGEYKIWLPYSKDYIIKYSKPGYQTVPIAVSTKLPEDIKKCCFTPFEMSFHLFRPDGSHDSLYKKPIVTVRYETKLKSYFYSLDIDYYIQKMYIKAESDRGRKLKDQAYIAKHKDSLEIERKYMGLINSGNVYYSLHQYSMAHQMFTKALELKPKRRYPAYKLEDIETQLVIFNQPKDSLPKNADSIVASIMNPSVEIKKPIEYNRKTPEELQAIFKKDLYNQIASETKDKRELAKRLKFVENEVINKKEEVAKIDTIKPLIPIVEIPKIDSTKLYSPKAVTIKNDSIVPIVANIDIPKVDSIKPEQPKIDSIKTIATIKPTLDSTIIIHTDSPKKDTIKPKPILVQTIKPTKEANRPFDKVAYQDSLLKRYPNERTIEVINEDYKKITKVTINRDNMVTIFLKVEHQWGGVFFFKDNTPYPLENISKSYFEVATKLLSEKDNVDTKPKTQSKTATKTPTKAVQSKSATKTPKK